MTPGKSRKPAIAIIMAGNPLSQVATPSTPARKGSERAREILGEGFVDHFVRTREWEVRQYERAVTNWELERYLELI